MASSALNAAGRSRALDLCTLVWPELDRTTKPPATSSPARWLVGWNPRGLVVVAALTIDAATHSDALAMLQKIREDVVTTSPDGQCIGGIPTARGLRILGRVREATGHCEEDAAAAASVKSLRQNADVWLDLVTPGPTAELFVCGYKVQRFHLHVVHADPTLDQLQLSPAVTSVLSHYGIEGTAAIAYSGARPHPVPQGQSVFEGRMIPKHLLALTSRHSTAAAAAHNGLDLMRAASTGAPRSDMNGRLSVSSTPSKPQSDSTTSKPLLDLSAIGAPPPPNLFGGGDSFTSSHGGSDGGAQTPQKDGHLPLHKESSLDTPVLHCEPSNRPEEAAPRLDFPEQADITELSCWLALCNDGCRIRRQLAKQSTDTTAGKKASKPHDVVKRNDKKVTTPGPGAPPSQRTPNMLMAVILMRVLVRLLPTVTFLARLFYVARMLEYRQREFINWLGLLTGHTTTCGLHPLMPHVLKQPCSSPLQRQYCVRGFFFRVLVDICLGALAALFLVHHEDNIIDSVRNFAWYGLHDLHVGCVDWFRGWPGGFKMNDDLNMCISAFHMAVLRMWEDCLDRVSVDWIHVSYQILTFTAPLGASFSLCFVADCCNVVTQHLRMQFHIMEVVYRAFVALVSCLFAQFRGKKYNPLRKRTDAAEFAMDQMLLGTLLCTAALFLFPTVALYYFYFALVRTSVWVVQEALMSAALGCGNVPLFHVLFWVMHRSQLPSGVVLRQPQVRPMTVEPSSPTVAKILRSSSAASPIPATPTSNTACGIIVDLSLDVLPMPLAFVLFDHTVLRWSLTRPFTVGKLLRFIILGEEKPCVNPQLHLFPHLVRDPLNPTVPGR